MDTPSTQPVPKLVEARTVTLRDHVDFSLLGIFMGGDHFDVEVHASAEAREIP